MIDSGSLEHVFNISQALRNCLEMVESGGHFISIGPANNAMGHGFYQFSPELYFRILSPHKSRGGRQPFHRHRPAGPAQMLYEKVYCARGQAENLIKAHKLHLPPIAPRAARRPPTSSVC